MQSNILSYLLTAYAIYNTVSNKNALQEQLANLEDMRKDINSNSDEIDELAGNKSKIDEDIILSYILRLGYPSTKSRLAGNMLLQVQNKSKERTYLLRGLQIVPLLGTPFCCQDGQKLFNLYWPAGLYIEPGQTREMQIHYNNLSLDKTVINTIVRDLTEKFGQLTNEKITMTNGIEADVWIRANAPHAPMVDYLIERLNVSGSVRWVGNNFLPGAFNKKDAYGGEVLSFDRAKEFFK